MADEFRNFNRKRQIIKMDLVKQTDYTDQVIVCVPKFAWDVARSLIGQYGQWRTTYAMEYFFQYYRIPNNEEWDIISASVADLLGASDMSCDLTEALECICNAVQEVAAATLAGSVGSGYLPAEQAAPSEFEDNLQDNFPDGFADRSEYELYKCGVAARIVSDIKADFTTMATVDLVGLTALGLAPLLLTGIPGLLLVVGYTVLVTSLVAGSTFFLEAASVLEDEFDELVCALFDGSDVETAKTAFINRIGQSPSWTNTLFAGTFGSAMLSWLNWNNLNDLFELNPDRIPLAHDCSGCAGECFAIDPLAGIILSETETTVAVRTVLSAGCFRAQLFFNHRPGVFCGSPVDIVSVVPRTVATPCSGIPIYNIKYQDHTTAYQGSAQPSNILGVGEIGLIANQDTTWDITFSQA